MSNQHKKIVIIGASGTIGKAIVKLLEEKSYEVIRVSRNAGDFKSGYQ